MNPEDHMWKNFCDKLKRQKSHNALKIQQVDDGFFEKFGILLQQQSALAEQEEQRDRFNHAEAAAQVMPELSEDEAGKVTIGSRMAEGEEGGEEQPLECPLIHSDSENEDISDIFDMAVGLNIEELYSEILYEIVHNVGCDVSCEIGQTALFSYAQDAFKVPNDKHEEMLAAVQQKEAPDVLLNVEIVEAKDLASKDSNGLSDPFVTLFLASDSSHRYNTSVKAETLNPVWEEHFALPIAPNVADDTLCLEVWDFDPAETVREKLAKISEVKGVKGLRKLVKEIAVTCATGQHENELIGKASIPLKAIPASGMTMWYSLDKKNKITRQGVVKVNLAFSSEKNSMVAAQEHRHLIKLLLLHELELSKVCAYWWCGNFSPQAEALLTQHSAQSGLSAHSVAMCQWATYASVHGEHPLSFALFSSLLEKLTKAVHTSAEEDSKLFWESTKKLLPSCFSLIRKIRKKCNDKSAIKQLVEVLKIIAKISTLEPPENFDLFPPGTYAWIPNRPNGPYSDVREVLESAVRQGTSNWFDYIQVNNAVKEETDENKLQYLLKIIGLVRTDLQKAIEYYDKLFQEILNCQYAKTVFKLSEEKISAMVEPEVVAICKSMKMLTYSGEGGNRSPDSDTNDPLAVGTTLFELYLMLQRFITLGSGLSASGTGDYKINNFHSWFYGGVAQWLDIAVYKALQRIEKAVELDTLAPVDTTVQISSSAVDTLTIFYQVQVFWQQLNWPDVEGCYTFVAKIIDDICRCCVFYADKMSIKIDGLGDVKDMYEQRFEVTSGLCLAINNIDYVRLSLDPFIDKLDKDDLIHKLSELRTPLEAQRCEQTLENVLENAKDTVRNKIIELLEIVASKMVPSMKRLLVEGAELLHQDSNSVDRLMMYLDDNLATLHEYLNEENFNQTLEVMWANLGNILRELLQSNLDKRRPPSFFSNLHETLNLMVKSFKHTEDDSSNTCPALKEIEDLLVLNGLETVDLIHRVYMKQWEQQAQLKDTPYGKLTIRIQFLGNNLVIEVMNARDLIPMDTNGQCDSFVRIHILPEERFTGVVKPKTQTHNKNRFPLYDEVFTINLTPEQRNIKDGLVMFSVKDKDFLGMANQYMADAFVHFSEIPSSSGSISSQPQIHLMLNRPNVLDSQEFKALEFRIGDKMAKEFAKRIRQKLNTTPS